MASEATQLSGGKDLVEAVASFVFDPLGYVCAMFPWEEPGTRLVAEIGPDVWQAEILMDLGVGVERGEGPVQIAVKSGHGVGKTALIAWIIHWFISTRPHPQIVCTANTKTQLETKTWRELAKWNDLAFNGDWFNWSATTFRCLAAPGTWFAAAIPWNKDKSEAFAGTHEEHVLVVFDESSLIDDTIWEVAEGAFTTPGSVWLAMGNPTRNIGRFIECFRRYRHRWRTFTVDSRTAKKADRTKINQWEEDYGEDSDFFRVRVRGLPPRVSSMQFIGQDIVEAAKGRVIHPSSIQKSPIIIGVDVARYGDDKSVIYVRQGLATMEIRKYMATGSQWLMDFAGIVSEAINVWEPDGVFIDEVGLGAGVVDRLRQLGYNDAVGVNGAREPQDKDLYLNKRVECWGRMRDWLKSGGAIPNDQELIDDLTAIEYGFAGRNQFQLEKKEDMKARGFASPDIADALALTFAYPVQKKSEIQKILPHTRGEQVVRDWDFLEWGIGEAR